MNGLRLLRGLGLNKRGRVDRQIGGCILSEYAPMALGAFERDARAEAKAASGAPYVAIVGACVHAKAKAAALIMVGDDRIVEAERLRADIDRQYIDIAFI